MKKLVLSCLLAFGVFFAANAQEISLDELKSMKADKQAALDALAGEVADLDKQIGEFPGWTIGGVGILGFDLNSNSDWFAINQPNSASNGYGLSASAFANKNESGYFWRNLLTLNLKQVNTTLNSNLDNELNPGNKIKAITDALDLSSLYGKKLSEKWAISAEGKYTSTLLSFNNPGKLTLSAGATWTPIDNLVVLIHPLAYEFNFPGDFVSAPGAKIGAQYAATILPGVSWSSNLSAFIPYSGGEGILNEYPLKADSPANDPVYDTSADAVSSLPVDYGTSGLTNWTWINSFSTNIFRGVGVGFNIGLRKDAQIANQWQYQRTNTYDPNVEQNNPLQVYYSLGLSYTL